MYHLTSADQVRELWRQLDARGEFTLPSAKVFVSGMSTHADRVSTIRWAYSQYGVMVDPHTADGINAGRVHREGGVPLVCLETALPAKFEATIREALGRPPERPKAYADIESRLQRFEVIAPDVEAVKAFIVQHTPGQ